MFSRRIAAPMLCAVVILAATSGIAEAAKPVKPEKVTPAAGERALTPQERAEADAKLAAAEAYVAAIDRSRTGLVSLACVTPTAVGGGATIDACYTPQGFLTVSARDQTKGIYCGPAVGQVISNYTWKMSSSANKYGQGTIANWMLTDANGGTSAPYLEDGLERATSGAPRRPANWNWVVSDLRDTDGDGTVADQLHAMVRSNISDSKMPLAIPVKPYEAGAKYHLSSWVKPVSSVGHWIAAYGWVGLWTGNDSARLYYTDSSKDEGGSTGKFWDPVSHIAWMIMDHTGRIVW